jgi:hypothetical protein
MSLKGIYRFGKILSDMQQARGELFAMNNKQDVRLGQMLQEMKDLVKERFANETLDIDEIQLRGG